MESSCREDTLQIAYQMARNAQPGQVYALIGDLGVGKTVFTKGFAEGLGIEEPVSSPTFTFLCITSTFTGSRSRRRWRRSASMTMYTETASA